MNTKISSKLGLRTRQAGAITMISAVLILILLTEMVIYAVQTGVFEQRKSSNEMRQKIAFHMADSAIQQGKQFMLKNAKLASSDIIELLPKVANPTGPSDYDSGWLSTADPRWLPCSGVTGASGSHPCFAESNGALRAGSYFYSVDGDFNLPIDPKGLSVTNPPPATTETEQVAVHALLCMLELDRSKDPIVQGCTTDAALQDNRYFLITLAARGQADCLADGSNCKAEALVSEKIGSFGPGGGEGGPGVPLTARTAVPPSGTVEMVPNPNGGGVGVPISTWANTNPACPASTDPAEAANPVNPQSGSWATCEAHEWYGQDFLPTDFECPSKNGNGNASCRCSTAEGDRLLSYASQGDQILNIDVLIDPVFPCDLFAYMFGISKVATTDANGDSVGGYQEVKNLVPSDKQISASQCGSLNFASEGTYWISGGTCTLNGQIGSKNAPVLLISAAGDTRVSAGAEIFGVLFVTDAEVPTAEFTGNGHATIYGAAVMDAAMKNFNGTFQIVYVDNLIQQALETGLFGAVQGGWTDFHVAWQ